jgi:hypothetical protein
MSEIVWKREKVDGETHTVSSDGRWRISPAWVDARRYGNGQGKTQRGYNLLDEIGGVSRYFETVRDAKEVARLRATENARDVRIGIASWTMPLGLDRYNALGAEVYGQTLDGERIYFGLFARPLTQSAEERAETIRAAMARWCSHHGIDMIEED